MTGTAEEVTGELWRVYALPVVNIPTHKNSRRKLLSQRVYASDDLKWQAVAERAVELQAKGRPVLIGTQSLAASEYLSEQLHAGGIEHQLLNARQDAAEAAIVAAAGEPEESPLQPAWRAGARILNSVIRSRHRAGCMLLSPGCMILPGGPSAAGPLCPSGRSGQLRVYAVTGRQCAEQPLGYGVRLCTAVAAARMAEE